MDEEKWQGASTNPLQKSEHKTTPCHVWIMPPAAAAGCASR
jgi:hypothetical protein